MDLFVYVGHNILQLARLRAAELRRQVCCARIPNALLRELKDVGLALAGRVYMHGTQGEEIRFYARVSEFVVRFFQQKGG